ncbi:MAG: hypothetical protein JSS28_04160, partial [Proteobacteria bacterium]|nr:hypothetical protein [Pseudomonadota bacterium]
MQKHHQSFQVMAAIIAAACATLAAPSHAAPIPGEFDPNPAQYVPKPARTTQIRYSITDLGTLPGGTFSQAAAISLTGLVAGGSNSTDGFEHAVLWFGGKSMDIGPSGMNSDAFGVNAFGVTAGQTETGSDDPYAENFCGYFTGLQCRPFLWQGGTRKLLPLLGGNNGSTGDNVNIFGQVAGVAETAQIDPDCPNAVSAVGTGPQQLYFKPVIWGPQPNTVRELRTLPGDDVGIAFWVNDLGQAVGVTGTCANTSLPPLAVGPHAVLWERDGTPVDLGNLGGLGDPERPGIGNVAHAINERGQVVGVSALADNTATHGFLWTRKGKMISLDPLPDHSQSGAIAINNLGVTVGVSF